MTGSIYGTGFSLPKHCMDNQDVSKLVDTSDEWIRERTGISQRYIVTEETTVSMAAEAGRKALQDAGVAPEEVEMILVATCSSNVILPCTACEVQRLLGAENAVCMDLNAACCGFMMAYDVAQMYIQQGRYRKVLIIGSESLSNLVDWTDRGTCILFGDGSGAALVKASEEASYKSVLHSDGSKGLALTCDGRIRQEQYGNYLKMDGKAVFQFAVKKVSQVILEVLETNGCTLEEVDWFVLHQANKRIIEAVARRLDVEITKFPMNLQKYGNTSSASIPILLDELHREKKLAKGDKILIAGFGAGLSWGATLMDWAIEN